MGTARPARPAPMGTRGSTPAALLIPSRTEQVTLLSGHTRSLAQRFTRIRTLPRKHVARLPPQIFGYVLYLRPRSHVPLVPIPLPFVLCPHPARGPFPFQLAGETPRRAELLWPSTVVGARSDTLPTCRKLEGVSSCITE